MAKAVRFTKHPLVRLLHSGGLIPGIAGKNFQFVRSRTNFSDPTAFTYGLNCSGGSSAMTVNEYHQYAQECLRWAAQAKTEDQREAFLEMAQAWTMAASFREGTGRLVPHPVAISSFPERY